MTALSRPFLTVAAVVACFTAFAGDSSLTAKCDDAHLPLRTVVDVPTAPAGKAFSNQTPRMDYESIDPARRRLYIAYLGADEIIVFDLDTNKVIGHIQDTPGVHGTLAIPGLHRLYASATGADLVAAIDETSFKIVARAAGGEYPDGIAYDPQDHKIFVSDEHGASDTVIDVETNRRVDTIELGGDAGNTQFDADSGLIFSDVQTRNDIAAIDPRTDTVVARHALPGCDHDHGLLLDAPRRLAFVACDGNAKLLLMDMRTWRVLSTYDVGDDPDVLAFDVSLKRLYVAAESGVVAIFEENGRSLKPLGKAFLADGAHTVAVDPMTHGVYFALQNLGGKPVIRVMVPTDLEKSSHVPRTN